MVHSDNDQECFELRILLQCTTSTIIRTLSRVHTADIFRGYISGSTLRTHHSALQGRRLGEVVARSLAEFTWQRVAHVTCFGARRDAEAKRRILPGHVAHALQWELCKPMRNNVEGNLLDSWRSTVPCHPGPPFSLPNRMSLYDAALHLEFPHINGNQLYIKSVKNIGCNLIFSLWLLFRVFNNPCDADH